MDNYTPNPFIIQPIYDPTRPFATLTHNVHNYDHDVHTHDVHIYYAERVMCTNDVH